MLFLPDIPVGQKQRNPQHQYHAEYGLSASRKKAELGTSIDHCIGTDMEQDRCTDPTIAFIHKYHGKSHQGCVQDLHWISVITAEYKSAQQHGKDTREILFDPVIDHTAE